MPFIKNLVLLRHGESIWNKENRFTGWTDIDLSEKGIEEAKFAAQNLKREGFIFDMAYTSYDIVGLNIPTGIPLVYELDTDLKPVTHYFLGDEEDVKRAMSLVADQGKQKPVIIG